MKKKVLREKYSNESIEKDEMKVIEKEVMKEITESKKSGRKRKDD